MRARDRWWQSAVTIYHGHFVPWRARVTGKASWLGRPSRALFLDSTGEGSAGRVRSVQLAMGTSTPLHRLRT